MRIRPLLALSVVAVSGVLLAGCAGGGAPGGSASPSAPASTPAASTCLLPAEAGTDSDAVKVTGKAPELSVTVPSGLALTDVQRTVVSEGDGPVLGSGALVSAAYTVLDGATGTVLADSSKVSADTTKLVPVIVDQSAPTVLGAAVDCVPLGSTVVLTIPGAMLGQGASSIVVVAQSVAQLPTRATGAEQPAVDGTPTVALADDGAPTITMPDGLKTPETTQLTLLKKGDGPTVKSGDTVSVQYIGALSADGSVFDSSWKRGAPTQFPTTGVVEGFQKALEGQTVGSQVLAVIPPAEGYADKEQQGIPAGSTLVFVVDILGTQHAPAQ